MLFPIFLFLLSFFNVEASLDSRDPLVEDLLKIPYPYYDSRVINTSDGFELCIIDYRSECKPTKTPVAPVELSFDNLESITVLDGYSVDKISYCFLTFPLNSLSGLDKFSSLKQIILNIELLAKNPEAIPQYVKQLLDHKSAKIFIFYGEGRQLFFDECSQHIKENNMTGITIQTMLYSRYQPEQSFSLEPSDISTIDPDEKPTFSAAQESKTAMTGGIIAGLSGFFGLFYYLASPATKKKLRTLIFGPTKPSDTSQLNQQ